MLLTLSMFILHTHLDLFVFDWLQSGLFSQTQLYIVNSINVKKINQIIVIANILLLSYTVVTQIETIL